nr:MAG TPA_asm: hypothetical protein [Caudoviricetes sp.]
MPATSRIYLMIVRRIFMLFSLQGKIFVDSTDVLHFLRQTFKHRQDLSLCPEPVSTQTSCGVSIKLPVLRRTFGRTGFHRNFPILNVVLVAAKHFTILLMSLGDEIRPAPPHDAGFAHPMRILQFAPHCICLRNAGEAFRFLGVSGCAGFARVVVVHIRAAHQHDDISRHALLLAMGVGVPLVPHERCPLKRGHAHCLTEFLSPLRRHRVCLAPYTNVDEPRILSSLCANTFHFTSPATLGEVFVVRHGKWSIRNSSTNSCEASGKHS